jgi:hypothetical protein
VDQFPEQTIRLFRNKLTETGTLKRVMKAFDWQLRKKGYIPMSGQIVDASLGPAPKQRNTEPEKAAIKAGKSAREIWPDEPDKAAQKDVDARWTLKVGGKVRTRPDGTPLPMIAIPVFGYKSHISIDRRFGFIREGVVTPASAADGRVLRRVVSTDNTAGDRTGQCDEILHPRPDRACLRPPEEPLRPVHPDDRPRPRRGQTDSGQSRLQHGPADLPRTPRCRGVSLSGLPKSTGKPPGCPGQRR